MIDRDIVRQIKLRKNKMNEHLCPLITNLIDTCEKKNYSIWCPKNVENVLSQTLDRQRLDMINPRHD